MLSMCQLTKSATLRTQARGSRQLKPRAVIATRPDRIAWPATTLKRIDSDRNEAAYQRAQHLLAKI